MERRWVCRGEGIGAKRRSSCIVFGEGEGEGGTGVCWLDEGGGEEGGRGSVKEATLRDG